MFASKLALMLKNVGIGRAMDLVMGSVAVEEVFVGIEVQAKLVLFTAEVFNAEDTLILRVMDVASNTALSHFSLVNLFSFRTRKPGTKATIRHHILSTVSQIILSNLKQTCFWNTTTFPDWPIRKVSSWWTRESPFWIYSQDQISKHYCTNWQCKVSQRFAGLWWLTQFLSFSFVLHFIREDVTCWCRFRLRRLFCYRQGTYQCSTPEWHASRGIPYPRFFAQHSFSWSLKSRLQCLILLVITLRLITKAHASFWKSRRSELSFQQRSNRDFMLCSLTLQDKLDVALESFRFWKLPEPTRNHSFHF